MKSEKKIVITVGTDGEVSIDGQGFPDGTCLKETADVEAALGKVTDRTKKPEAFITPTPTQKIGF